MHFDMGIDGKLHAWEWIPLCWAHSNEIGYFAANEIGYFAANEIGYFAANDERHEEPVSLCETS